MTNTYKIPLTKDGEIDYEYFIYDIFEGGQCKGEDMAKALVTHVENE